MRPLSDYQLLDPADCFFSHLFQVGRLPIRCQSHDFVFIPIVGKAKKLSKSLVETTKGVGKVNSPIYLNRCTLTQSPGTTGKITEAIYRYHNRLLIGRYVEGG